jgi:hypothetical protein
LEQFKSGKGRKGRKGESEEGEDGAKLGFLKLQELWIFFNPFSSKIFREEASGNIQIFPL